MEKKGVLISIVMPVLNRASIVGRTLDSIFAQSNLDFELIIIDNGSTDGTLDVLKDWGNRHSNVTLAQCSEAGAAAARNAGLAIVSTPWVMFFDSDDTMEPSHLQQIVDAISDNPKAEVIGWDTLYHFRNGMQRVARFFGKDMQKNNLFHGAMATQRWCARTELVRRVGAWDCEVKYWNDIELGSRIIATNPTICHIGMGGVHVYDQEVSITSDGAADPAKMEAALIRIEKTIGTKGRKWCRLKRAMEYGRYTRIGSADGRVFLNAMKPSLLLRFVFEYTRLGGRGAAQFFAH